MVIRNLSLGSVYEESPRWYFGGDPVSTAFYNALTITFPQGERFFIESVRPYKKAAPSGLARDISDFIKQEALHTREHAAFNRQVEASGYDATACFDRVSYELGRFKSRSPNRQLGLTIALEHFTALLAHQLLAYPHHLEPAPEPVRQLWRWHALEEIEHKAVAFDTFVFATREWTGLRRWAFRCFAMIETSYQFAKVLMLNMQELYAQDGLTGRSMVWPTVKYLFGKKGIVRGITKGWLAWFTPSFHPWDHDDSELIAPVAKEFDQAPSG